MAKNGKNTEKDRIFHTTKGEKLGNDNKRQCGEIDRYDLKYLSLTPYYHAKRLQKMVPGLKKKI